MKDLEKKHNVSPREIIEHQKKCGIETDIVKGDVISDNDVCEWKHDAEFKFAKSQCGFIDTHRIDFRKFKYCPYCGKKIKMVE